MKAIGALLLLSALPAAAQEGETYQNPADHKAYTAPGGWQTYAPEKPAAPSTEKVTLENVRLLQAQEEIGARTSVADLASFIKRAQAVAGEVFAPYDKAAALLVQFTCTPGSCSAQLASQGDPPQALLQSYYDRLIQLQPLKVTGEVKFQFLLRVKP